MDGRIIGVELTELVNQTAIEAQINASSSYSEELLRFDFNMAMKAVREIISNKERKIAPVLDSYDELVLLIHTDEFMLMSDQFVLRDFPLGEAVHFRRIYYCSPMSRIRKFAR